MENYRLIRVNKESTIQAFELFRKECILFCSLLEFAEQFNPERSETADNIDMGDVIPQTVPSFFNLLNFFLQNELLLSISRLTDPSKDIKPSYHF